MTTGRRDGLDTPFGKWIRNHPGLDSIKERLSIQDQDYWIHQYRAHHDRIGARAVDSIMLIEVKTFGRGEPFAQRDTLTVIDRLLRFNGNKPYRSYRKVTAGYEKRIVRCFGCVTLIMSGDSPENSEWMLWRGIRIDVDLLVKLLRFEHDPHCPSKRLPEPRRHHLPSEIQDHPRLPLEAAE
jgi:hypothetical protein